MKGVLSLIFMLIRVAIIIIENEHRHNKYLILISIKLRLLGKKFETQIRDKILQKELLLYSFI